MTMTDADESALPEGVAVVLLEFGAPGAPPRGAAAARAVVAAHRRRPDAALALSIGPLDGDPHRICTAAEIERFFAALARSLARSPWAAGIFAALGEGLFKVVRTQEGRFDAVVRGMMHTFPSLDAAEGFAREMWKERKAMEAARAGREPTPPWDGGFR